MFIRYRTTEYVKLGTKYIWQSIKECHFLQTSSNSRSKSPRLFRIDLKNSDFVTAGSYQYAFSSKSA